MVDTPRRYVNDTGLPVNEQGRLLTGSGRDSEAYKAFYRTYRTVRDLAPDSSEYQTQAETMFAAMEQMSDAGELENAEALLSQLAQQRQRPAPAISPEYARAMELRKEGQGASGTPEQRDRTMSEAIEQIVALAAQTGDEEQRARISDEARLLEQVRLMSRGRS